MFLPHSIWVWSFPYTLKSMNIMNWLFLVSCESRSRGKYVQMKKQLKHWKKQFIILSRMLRVEIRQFFPTKSPLTTSLKHGIYSSHKIKEDFFQLFSSMSDYLQLCVIREVLKEGDFWVDLWRMIEISLGGKRDVAFPGCEKYAVFLESRRGWKDKRRVETGSSQSDVISSQTLCSSLNLHPLLSQH